MDTIKTYLDNVFGAFPKTERVQVLKSEILSGMEEKYNSLKREGKSEHEAVGSVISNFGSIDEIVAELGIEQSKDIKENFVYVSNEEAENYLSATKKSSVRIGIGVWLILIGASALVYINSMFDTDTMGIFVLFAAIIAAVALFIISGIDMGKYEEYTKNTVSLDLQTKSDIEQRKDRFNKVFVIQIISGIALILFAIGGVVAVSEMRRADMMYALSVPFLLFSIGAAVFLFVTAGMTWSSYNVLLNKGDYKNKVKNNKAERIISTTAAVYWPAATAIFLFWSFVWDAWDVSWVIWPVAGVLFGAIAGGVAVWFGSEE